MYLFTPKYTKLCSYAFSQKTTIVLKKEEKQIFHRDVWKKKQILKQVFKNASDSNQVFQKRTIFSQLYTTRLFLYREFYSGSTFETSYLPHIRFGTEVLTTQQIFTWNWFRNIKLSWTICFQKIFSSIHTVKMSNWRSPTFLESLFLRALFLEKNMLWIENSEKNQILNQFFCNASDY